MADNDIIRTVKIDPGGGPVTVEVLFGFANIGVYRMFRWDANRQFTQFALGDNVDHEPDVHPVGVDAGQLLTHQLSYETQVESPREGPGQAFAVFVLVRQDGRIVPGGTIERSGALPASGSKSTIGFVRFEAP